MSRSVALLQAAKVSKCVSGSNFICASARGHRGVGGRRVARLKLAPPLLLGLVLPLAGGAYAAAGKVSAEPAEWRTYDLLLDFQDLPRTYSCDELWYKFRDVLRKLGARAYMTITPYDCGYLGGGEARSPHVEVKFQLPQPLQGAATRYAQISVFKQPVRLAPGAPRTLLTSDCEFVRQLQGTLLAELPLPVTVADFDCSAAPASFALTVDALLAAPAPSRQAQAPGAAPRS
jgi:hypothetical protein